jgi:2-dehydro-3-deoxy-D-arabinonate dehydratase
MSNDLFLVKFRKPDGPARLGVEDDSWFRPLAAPNRSASQALQLDWLLSADPEAPRAGEFMEWLRGAMTDAVARESVATEIPVGRQEVWAAGVTYKRSEEAREHESNNSNVYRRVYDATRPELFFKSLGHDVVPWGGSVGIRFDAAWSVPEPELVVVMNAHMEVIGFTIGNDMSSRDIEGENPLYLPQAKVYDGACALGPRIWLQPGATAWPHLSIQMQIERDSQIIFDEATSTAALHRPLGELIDYLGRCKRFPCGAMLFTGTGIVPPDDFTLAEGDLVRIRIDPIGELLNKVAVVGKREAALT